MGPTAYTVLDPAARDRAARTFRTVHHLVVTAGVAAAVVDSVPRVAAASGRATFVVMAAVLAFCAFEYVVRLVTAPDAPWAIPGHPWEVRLRWAISPAGLVDFLAVLPLAVAFALGADPEVVHFVGILWVFKLARYAPGLGMLGRVIHDARGPLLSVLAAFLVVLVMAATLAHLLEAAGQPDAFGSIPGALWWTVVTLTTTGYGDMTPLTPLGRLLAGVVMICGIAVFALWAGILATAFAEEVRRRQFVLTWDLVAKVPYFKNLGAATIAEVTRLLKPREVSSGQMVMRKGDPGDCMYFIVSGEIEVEIEPAPIRLEAGAFFGEIALITGEPRMASAVAKAGSTLLVLDIADFRDLAARQPELTKAINEEATRRIGELKASAAAR